ncbi:hypothetical protein BS50DRAFT_578909 [Corynespora cassiicola Philippines]|uniref:Uncharacterized protein n=1 Tax=Corynespora cassiicola Philippines TaxID=1448308 RepID=A0A2T2N6R1_CORCC|nr:hypothetical protein BS50DRAFT_578909 [Corynespora cassiicola Philippines]
MAPFRSRDRSNRSGRGQVEHNVLEGLPINQYREVEVTIGPNSTDNKPVDKDAWPEPPMPRDAHLLPEHSQQILRAARSGRVYQPPAPLDEDRDLPDEDEEPKQVQQGFTVKKWVKVARHLEEPEPEFLAKRRKGLPSQYAVNGQAATQPTPMRETKVKKTDAEGNVSVYKVLVPEGQTVEGEVQPTDAAVIEAAPAAAAPGTVVEGVGVVNAEGVVVASEVQQTPPRRKPPPPKKKSKRGPGRGKKKVVFAEGSGEQGTPASATGSDILAISRIKESGSVEPSDGDTPMADAGEEEGSGEDGSDDEDREEDREHSTTPGQPDTPFKRSVEPTSAPPPEPKKEPETEPTKPFTEQAPEPVPEPAAPVSVSDTTSAAEPSASAPTDSTTAFDADDPMVIDDPEPSAPQAQPEAKSTSGRDPSSSPEMPLSAMSHSRQNSLNQIPTIPPLGPAVDEPPAPEAVVLEVAEPEPVSEPAQSPKEPTPLELVSEPVVEPASEKSTEPEAEPPAEPAAEPAVEPAVEPVVEPAAEPPAEPPAEPVAEPVAEPTVELTVEPVVESAPEPETKPSPETAVEPASVPATEDAPVPEPEPATEPASEQAPESIPEPAPEPPTDPTDTPKTEEASASADVEMDLLGSLERQLEKDSETYAGS